MSNKSGAETAETFSSKSNIDVVSEAFWKHFLSSFDKKQLINILIGGPSYFFYPWLSSKPKHKKDKKAKEMRGWGLA